jgi:hypothetical protein
MLAVVCGIHQPGATGAGPPGSTGNTIDAPLVSGQPIRVGAGDGTGPLASIGISSTPLGAATVFGGKRPDVFVSSDRWYPGFHLYRWMRDTPEGVPVFSQPIAVDASNLMRLDDHLLQDHAVASYIFQTPEARVYGIWAKQKELLVALFNREQLRFDTVSTITLTGLPRLPRAATGVLLDGGQMVLFMSVSDGVRYQAPEHHRSAEYRPFDGAGIWRGGIPRDAIYRTFFSFPATPESARAEVVVPHEHGIQFGANGMAILRHRGRTELILGTLLGGLHTLSGCIHSDPGGRVTKRPIVDETGISLRHPETWANVIGYPARDSGGTDLLVSGEGGMHYYIKQSETSDHGHIVYKRAAEAQQILAELFGGTLVVPSVVDWNGDGRLDIVAGNSQGFLLFFKNVGENTDPRFAPPLRLAAGGELVHIQGRYGSIQGPGEARWGYTCPNVADWNGDGLPDVLMNDIRGIHSVYLNTGTRTHPRLAPARTLYLDDLDLHGTWRTRPGIAQLDGRNVYITLDDDDQFHLYRQVDALNVEDGGKLRLADGSPISANFLDAGGRGRTKFEIVDWDGDGRFDLVVGTPRHGTVPVADESGLPWVRDRAGAAILFLRNLGSNRQPVFATPKLMHFRGQPVHLGQHSCSPAAAFFEDQPDLIVGTENGRLIYYDREDIEWE